MPSELSKTDFSFAPGCITQQITTETRQYILAFPLRCKTGFSPHGALLESEWLGIRAKAESQEAAEEIFQTAFDQQFRQVAEKHPQALTDSERFLWELFNRLVAEVRDF